MAEITVPYVRRQLARRQLTGGGGVPGQPTVPDVSGVFGAARQVGEDINQAADAMAQVAARRQKARDVATLTALESSLDEQIAAKQQELFRDASIHPYDYRPLLQSYRDSLLDSTDIPERLKPIAKAKIQASTSRFLIEADKEGTKRGLEQAMTTLEVYEGQLMNKLAATTDPDARAELYQQARGKWGEYIDSGIISQPMAMERAQKFHDAIRTNEIAQATILSPDQTFEALKRGEYPDLPADVRLKLMDKAQEESREQLSMSEAIARRDDRILREKQTVTSSELLIRLRQGERGIIGTINASRRSRDISEEDHRILLNAKDTLDRHAEARSEHGARMADRAKAKAEENLLGWMKVGIVDGTIGKEQIPAMAKEHGWSGKIVGQAYDWADGEERARRNEAKSTVMARHNQAEQEARQQFKTAGFLDFDSFSEGLLGDFMVKMRETSAAYQGQKDPLEAKDELIKPYLQQLSTRGMDEARNIRSGLLYQSPGDLDAAFGTGQLDESTWKAERRRWKRLQELQPVITEAAPEPVKPAETESWRQWFERMFETGRK